MKRRPFERPMCQGGFLILVNLFAAGNLTAQDSSGASGMTTGLPGVSPAREAELMHIRAQAHAAKPAAEAAAMRRSAEQALDQKARQRILDEARETKRLKERASRDLEYERAANAYKKVSRNDIAAYSSNTGRVKVQQEVPSEILAALPPEDEEAEKPGGFRPIRGAARGAGAAGAATVGVAKKAVSWVPFVGKKKNKEDDFIGPTSQQPQPRAQVPVQPQVSAPPVAPVRPRPVEGNIVAVNEKEKDGVFKKMGNFIKRDKDLPDPTENLVPRPEAEKDGLFKGMFGGKDEEAAALAAADATTGAAAPPPLVPPPSSSLFGPHSGDAPEVTAPAPPAAVAPAPPSTATPVEPEKKGMFGGLKNLAGKLTPGKKDPGMAAGGDGTIDASLFPQAGDGQLMADNSGVPADKKKLKMPSLPNNLIPQPEIKKPEPPKPPMPKKDRSPIHSGGSDLYIVQAQSQFLQFGDTQMGSETVSLQPGTVVRMTKVGDEWSSIQLSNGATGIVKNKVLRPANSGEISAGSFPGASRSPSPPIASTSNASGGSARINRPVSATGAATTPETPGTVGPPVSIPESRLTSGGTNSGLPQ